jgi:hypothetical protein
MVLQNRIISLDQMHDIMLNTLAANRQNSLKPEFNYFYLNHRFPSDRATSVPSTLHQWLLALYILHPAFFQQRSQLKILQTKK